MLSMTQDLPPPAAEVIQTWGRQPSAPQMGATTHQPVSRVA